MRHGALGIASFALGFVGLFSTFYWWSSIICIVAIVLGIISLTDYLSYKWTAICGLCFAIMGIAILGYRIFAPMDSTPEIAQTIIEETAPTVIENNVTVATQEPILVQQEPQPTIQPTVTPTTEPSDDGFYHIGDSWRTDEWILTLDGVTETFERNSFQEAPEAVYLATFTLENIGYTDKYSDGLYIVTNETIVDSAGEMGYDYVVDERRFPEEIPIGARITFDSPIAVHHRGDFLLYISCYDSKEQKQRATFKVNVN